ncbi:phage portal protein [Arthrobacter sp. GMC3]|uniref:phage portal protein n=1 Tax=Arthrobacter sp. GMC3 TaxID=2058894 RepID=UPI0015E39248|nr:phage portal protein [Arthrobacter sp. GMC3]
MGLTPEQAVRIANRLATELGQRQPEAKELKDFFLGEQPLAYATKEWAESHGARYKGFSDNWCSVVASSSSERLGVIGFKLPGADGAESSVMEKKIWDQWLLNEQDSLSSQGFLDAGIARRAYCQVWGDGEGDAIINWRTASEAIVEYDAATGRKRVYGLNTWVDRNEGFEFATLYTVDEVWKFRKSMIGGSTSLILPARVLLALGGWDLIPGEESYGANHLGMVPIVEFLNRPILGTGPISDIAGVVSMQNAINLLWAYLFNAADHASMPARVVMGQEPPRIPILNDAGEKIGDKPVDSKALTEGRMLWLTGQNSSVGQWDAAKLDVFTAVIEQAVGHIAAQTRTPPHYLVANKGLSNLSGDALKAAETGLVQKVFQAQEFFEPRLRDVFELIATQIGEDKVAEDARLGQVRWKDAENRSDAQTSDAMVKDKQVGYPFEFLLEKRGHSPTEIARIMAMHRKELENDPLLVAQRTMQEVA